MSLNEALVKKNAADDFDVMERRTAPMPAAPSAAPKKASNTAANWCVSIVLFINTACLIAVLVAVMIVRSRVEKTLDSVDTIINEVQSGKPSAGMVSTANTVLSSAAGYFFLGSFDGTIAGFVQNIFLYDFSGMATDFVVFSQRVEAVFADVNSTSYEVNRVILTGARAIKSIASVVQAGFHNVNGATVAPDSAAMSDGIFRVDHIVHWLRSQANTNAFKTAGVVCGDFTQQMERVVWTGSWVDANGVQRTFDIRDGMHSVLIRVKDVCQRLAKLSA